MENITELPNGAVDKISLSNDCAIFYGYSTDSDVVGKASKGEDYFVYKKIDDWLLIGNHQWIKYIDTSSDSTTSSDDDTEAVEEVLEEEVLEEEVPEEEQEQETVDEEPVKFFTKLKRIFGR